MAHQTAVDIIRVISEAVNPTGQFAYLRTWDASLEFNEVDQKIFLYPISGQVDITNGYFETWTCSMGFFFQDAPDSTNEQREQLITNADVLLKAFILAADTVDGVQFSIVRKRPVYRDMAGTYSGYLVDFTLSLTEDICNGDTPSVIIPVGKTFCELVDECLGISPSGSNTKYLNEKGLWTTPAGGGGGSYTFENGLTEDAGTVKLGGELTEKTEIKTGADNWIAFGEVMDEQWGFVMGDLTDFDNSEQSFLGVFNFFNVHGFGEGLFMTAVGTQDAPQVVWVGSQQNGAENISGMAVYDEDAFVRQGFLRLSFDVNTKYGYAVLSSPSQYTPIDNHHQNEFFVDKEATRLKYHRSTDGDIISQKLTDSGILIEKYDENDDPTSKVPLNQIDYNGFIYLGAESLDGSWRFATSSGNLVIEKRVAGVWVTKQTLV